MEDNWFLHMIMVEWKIITDFTHLLIQMKTIILDRNHFTELIFLFNYIISYSYSFDLSPKQTKCLFNCVFYSWNDT